VEETKPAIEEKPEEIVKETKEEIKTTPEVTPVEESLIRKPITEAMRKT